MKKTLITMLACAALAAAAPAFAADSQYSANGAIFESSCNGDVIFKDQITIAPSAITDSGGALVIDVGTWQINDSGGLTMANRVDSYADIVNVQIETPAAPTAKVVGAGAMNATPTLGGAVFTRLDYTTNIAGRLNADDLVIAA